MASAIEFDCSKCGVAPGNCCVYVAPVPAHPGWAVDPHQAERAGKPMKRFHNGRYRTAWEWEQRAERQVVLEYLGWWLREFGDIFNE